MEISKTQARIPTAARLYKSAGFHALRAVLCAVLYAALYSGRYGGRAPFARRARMMRYVLEVVLHVLEAEKDVVQVR